MTGSCDCCHVWDILTKLILDFPYNKPKLNIPPRPASGSSGAPAPGSHSTPGTGVPPQFFGTHFGTLTPRSSPSPPPRKPIDTLRSILKIVPPPVSGRAIPRLSPCNSIPARQTGWDIPWDLPRLKCPAIPSQEVGGTPTHAKQTSPPRNGRRARPWRHRSRTRPGHPSTTTRSGPGPTRPRPHAHGPGPATRAHDKGIGPVRRSAKPDQALTRRTSAEDAGHLPGPVALP